MESKLSEPQGEPPKHLTDKIQQRWQQRRENYKKQEKEPPEQSAVIDTGGCLLGGCLSSLFMGFISILVLAGLLGM